jgi:hypothetical protein
MTIGTCSKVILLTGRIEINLTLGAYHMLPASRRIAGVRGNW